MDPTRAGTSECLTSRLSLEIDLFVLRWHGWTNLSETRNFWGGIRESYPDPEHHPAMRCGHRHGPGNGQEAGAEG